MGMVDVRPHDSDYIQQGCGSNSSEKLSVVPPTGPSSPDVIAELQGRQAMGESNQRVGRNEKDAAMVGESAIRAFHQRSVDEAERN